LGTKKFQDIGGRMKILRDSFGLTQSEFASKCGINRGYLASLEVGSKKPSSNIMSQLIETLNVSSNWLLTGEGTMFLSSRQNGDSLVGDDILDALEFYRTLGEAEKLDILTVMKLMEQLSPNRRKEIINYVKYVKEQGEVGELEQIKEELNRLREEFERAMQVSKHE
jgi:transcriptional regulator with XRE-family HTH domain